jgi:hypothetical protein
MIIWAHIIAHDLWLTLFENYSRELNRRCNGAAIGFEPKILVEKGLKSEK